MNKNRFFLSSYLILISMWWGWTVLVDMFVIRTVFATITNFFEAGNLGIAVFSKLNNLELIVSTIVVAIIAYQLSQKKKVMTFLVLSVVVWLITMIYFVYLTPKLITLTDLWKATDSMGISGAAGISDIQQEHQFYHNLYIGMDVFKLLLLSIMMILGLWKEKDWA
jgi:hypothetical protein